MNARASTFVSSTKGATGHLLGAAGAVEAVSLSHMSTRIQAIRSCCLQVYTILSVYNKRAPQTVNLIDPQPPLIATHILGESKKFEGESMAALSNAFGFGGTNASLLFRSYGDGHLKSNIGHG